MTTNQSQSLRRAVNLALTAGAVGTLVPAAAFAQSAPASDAGAATLEEVTVTGSRIRRVDAETASPVFTLDAAAIQQSGVQTLGDLVQRIPAIAGAATNPQVNNSGGDGASEIELRGLGSVRTLVLLNGRRVNTGATVDVNMLPVNMIERVEVLKEGAGAVYGSDAVGGVVNFITRTDFEGLEANADYGRTSRDDGQRYSFGLTMGAKGERGGFTAGVNYNKQEQVLAGDRDFSRFALYLYSGSSFEGGSSRTPTGRIRLPAGPLRTQFGCTSVTRVAGSAGSALGNYRCFGNSDFYNYQPINLIMTPQERTSAFTMVNYELTENVEVFGEFLFSRTQSAYQIAPLPFDAFSDDVVISRNSIFNPFGIDFGGLTTGFPNVQIRLESLGPRRQSFNTDRKVGNLGLRGSLFDTGWQWEAYVGYGRSDQNRNSQGYLFQPALAAAFGSSFRDAQGVARCGTPAAPIADCVPVNPFNVETAASVAALRQIAAPALSTFMTSRKTAAANVNGDLFQMPAGPAQAAFGVEYRSQGQKFNADFNVQARPPLFLNCNLASEACTGDSRGSFFVREAYGEVLVPILRDAPAAESLNLIGGLRWSDYSTSGNTTNMMAKVEWRPIGDLLIRGTYSEVFRAPTITDLFDSPTANSPQLNDPCVRLTQARINANPNLALACVGVPRDGSFVQNNSQVQGLLTSNQNLEAETGDVVTFGFVYEPQFLSGFSVSADYWSYTLEDVITSLDTQTAIDQCVATGQSQFCSLVQRAVGGANAGDIIVFRQPTFNLGETETTGIDVGLKYVLRDTPVGSFQASIDVTRVLKYENVPAPGAATDDYLGSYTNQFGNIAEHRALLGLGWAWAGVDALVSMRWVDNVTLEDADGGAATTTPLTVGSQAYTDLTLGYTYEPWGARLQLGVQNLADRQPPNMYQNNVLNANTDVSTYDTLGRRYFVSFNQKF